MGTPGAGRMGMPDNRNDQANAHLPARESAEEGNRKTTGHIPHISFLSVPCQYKIIKQDMIPYFRKLHNIIPVPYSFPAYVAFPPLLFPYLPIIWNPNSYA